MNSINKLLGVMLLAGTLALAGCATDPVNVENDFGNSVRSMVEAQTANPTAPVDDQPVDHGDGQRIQAVMGVYRGDVARPEDVKKDPNIRGRGR